MENNQNDPAADSVTPAIDTPAMLGEIIARRRLELGIKPGEPRPVQITAAMPERELSPEEIVARDEDAKRLALAEQKARRQGMFASLVEKVGERYSRCTFEAFQISSDRQRSAVDACREYADTLLDRIVDCNGLVLYGPVGTGKDHLAFAVSGAAIFRYGKFASWVNGQEWFGHIRDQMNDDGLSEQSLIQRLAAPDLLTLSDPLPPIGPLSQHQSTMLYRLIDARYHAGKPTIVTVNVKDDDEADSRIGVPTWDRMCDRSWKIHCNWPSFRKPARIVNGK
jgi:DNA replication protein DnaC